MSISSVTALRWSHKLSLMISQQWFKSWLGVLEQQAIDWANVDQDTWRHCGPNCIKVPSKRRREFWDLNHDATLMQFSPIPTSLYHNFVWHMRDEYQTLLNAGKHSYKFISNIHRKYWWTLKTHREIIANRVECYALKYKQNFHNTLSHKFEAWYDKWLWSA